MSPLGLLWPRNGLWLRKQLRCQSSLLLSAKKIQTICAFFGAFIMLVLKRAKLLLF